MRRTSRLQLKFAFQNWRRTTKARKVMEALSEKIFFSSTSLITTTSSTTSFSHHINISGVSMRSAFSSWKQHVLHKLSTRNFFAAEATSTLLLANQSTQSRNKYWMMKEILNEWKKMMNMNSSTDSMSIPVKRSAFGSWLLSVKRIR